MGDMDDLFNGQEVNMHTMNIAESNPTAGTPAPARLISVAEAGRRTSLSRTTMWRLARQGSFPAPIRITDGRNAYVEAEISD
jgi:predicted DNA-binding transcriptional regulator AlpA